MGPGGSSSQRWLPVHVLRQWQCGHVSDQESYTDSTDGWSSVNCGTLPPPMSKIPADRYRVEGSPAQPPPSTQRRDWARKALGVQNIFGPHRSVRKTKEDKKVSLEAGSGRRAWFLTRSVTDGRRHLRGPLPPTRPGCLWRPHGTSLGFTGALGGAQAGVRWDRRQWRGSELPVRVRPSSPLPILSYCGGCHGGRFWTLSLLPSGQGASPQRFLHAGGAATRSSS